jgi:hypothetical protein
MILPKPQGVYIPLFDDEMGQITRKVTFSESNNMDSLLCSHGVSAGTSTSMKIRLRPSISLTDIDQSRLILH